MFSTQLQLLEELDKELVELEGLLKKKQALDATNCAIQKAFSNGSHPFAVLLQFYKCACAVLLQPAKLKPRHGHDGDPAYRPPDC